MDVIFMGIVVTDSKILRPPSGAETAPENGVWTLPHEPWSRCSPVASRRLASVIHE
jgi:hypothetical protein